MKTDVSEVNELLKERYSETLSNVKQCSYDSDNDFVLCDSDLEVYDFDKIKEDYCRRMNYSDITSMDSLLSLEDNNNVCLIEFKNQKSIPYKDIRVKIHDSLYIMENDFMVPRESFSIFKIIVVYKPDKKKQRAIDGIRDHFKQQTGSEYDEIEHFKMFKDSYNICSYKFSDKDFLQYLDTI